MTERTCLRLVPMLALAVTLALPAAPARAEDPPSVNECKEYLSANELSQSRSMPVWLRLVECYQRLGSFGKAIETARQARQAAATPEERVEASQTLACALLSEPDAQAKAEAAGLFKETMASSGGIRARAGYYLALRELHREDEAAEFIRSLKQGAAQEDGAEPPCRTQNPRWLQTWNEFEDALGLGAADSLDTPATVGGEVTRPEIIYQLRPEVTIDARKHPGFSGQVIVKAIIDRQGRVQNVRVLKGQPYGLSDSAVASVKQWRFKPATLKGKPVKVRYILTVNFKVTDDLPPRPH
jgi:TonB family protein